VVWLHYAYIHMSYIWHNVIDICTIFFGIYVLNVIFRTRPKWIWHIPKPVHFLRTRPLEMFFFYEHVPRHVRDLVKKQPCVCVYFYKVWGGGRHPIQWHGGTHRPHHGMAACGQEAPTWHHCNEWMNEGTNEPTHPRKRANTPGLEDRIRFRCL
jgi:hypothetical protein